LAGEKRGLFYEALTYICIQKVLSSENARLNVYWNQTPDQMSIDTDITVGTSPKKPSHLFLVSHCTSEHNSDMKFWRNLGELREARLLLPAKTKVVCLLFDAKFKKNLLILQKYAYDTFLNVEEQDYGAKILSVAKQNASRLPASRDEKIELVNTILKSDDAIQSSVDAFCKSLAGCLKASRSHDDLWTSVKKSMKNRSAAHLANSKTTSLRRGLAKSLLLEKIPTRGSKISEEYIDLGIARKSIKGCVLNDSEIQGAVELLGKSGVEELHAEYSEMEQFRILVLPLRSISTFPSFWSYLRENWQAIIRPESLLKLLRATHRAPHVATGITRSQCPYIVPGWIVIYLITILKAKSGKRMSYGYSKIVGEIEKLGQSKCRKIVREILNKNRLNDHDLAEPRSSRTIEYGLRDWIFGDSRTNFDLKLSELALICHILSEKVSSVVGDKLDDALSVETKLFLVKDSIETKLLAHPSFQPLKKLVINELNRRKVVFEEVSYFPTPLLGLAVANGERVNVRAGSTNVLLANGTLIRWVSVSDAGKTHKVKEFCGRAWGFRIAVEPASGKVQQRTDIRKTILIVDGTFDNDDIRLLNEAGWDEVYYPDEICSAVDSVQKS